MNIQKLGNDLKSKRKYYFVLILNRHQHMNFTAFKKRMGNDI